MQMTKFKRLSKPEYGVSVELICYSNTCIIYSKRQCVHDIVLQIRAVALFCAYCIVLYGRYSRCDEVVTFIYIYEA